LLYHPFTTPKLFSQICLYQILDLMEKHKADLVADAAYPANANPDADADVGADADAKSTATAAPDAAVIAAALIALATSLPPSSLPLVCQLVVA
jgi:hypothetical protein